MRITLGGKQECKEARNEGGKKEGRKDGWANVPGLVVEMSMFLGEM